MSEPLREGFTSKTLVAGLLVFGAVVLNIGMFRGESSISDFFELQKSKETLARTVHTLERENKDLDQEIVRLKKSKAYAKKILRDKYHLTDENENIIFFAD